MKCPFCKTELNEGARVCHACGATEVKKFGSLTTFVFLIILLMYPVYEVFLIYWCFGNKWGTGSFLFLTIMYPLFSWLLISWLYKKNYRFYWVRKVG